MTVISDLSQDLVEDILSRVEITSLGAVRCTCRILNSLSKDQSFTKKHYYEKAIKESLMVMMYEFRACLTSINLHGTHNNKYLVDPSIKRLGKLKQLQFSQVFHCNGLLLCMTRENSKLMLWNPYLGQMRWIEPRSSSQGAFARFVIGYDSNNHYKILLFSITEFEMYDLESNSWRVLDIAPPRIWFDPRCVSLKGNLYLFITESIVVIEEEEEVVYWDVMLLSFDFTREIFGPPLQLPFFPYNVPNTKIISAVREEKLTMLYQRWDTCEVEIWITTNIEPNAVSWRNFLKVDMKPFFTRMFLFSCRSFIFVDEKEKVAVIFDQDRNMSTNYKAYVVGEEGYYKEVNLGDSKGCQLVCSYVPSMVQIQQGLGARRGKRKQRDY